MAGKVTTAPAELETDAAAEAAPARPSLIARLAAPLAFLRRFSRKQMVLIGGGAMLVIGASFAGYYFFLRGGTEAEAPRAIFFEMPEMVVNLSASSERPQYLRVKINLEVDNYGAIDAVKMAMPRVLDTFHVHLRELRTVDLEGSGGLFRLREELTRRVNHAIAPMRIRAVLFKEIVVQ